MVRPVTNDVTSNVTSQLKVDIWSDIACPWCYVGKRRFEAALERFEHRETVRLRWRSFELDPSAPRRREGSYAERLASKYGVPLQQAQAMLEQMTETAAAEGLRFRFDIIQPGNTFDAHRVLQLAAERGVQDAVGERFMKGYLEEGAAIGEAEEVARLAVEAGLEADEVQGVLGSDAYAREVRADEERATALGIRGVPFFVLDERFGVQGAQSPEAIVSVLERAHRDRQPALEVVSEGAACGPDGC